MTSNLPLAEQCSLALEKAAQARVKALRLRRLAERAFDGVLLATEARNVSEREAKARLHPAFITADDAALQAEYDAIVAKATADGLAIRFEAYRTDSATQRAEMMLGHGRT